jgi:hypothetical protein
MKRTTLALVLALSVPAFATPAAANEFTDVIDAFDMEYGDPFDLNLRVGYERVFKKGLIRRENFGGVPHDWDYFAYTDMFEFEQTTHILNLDLDIGLFRDLALRLRIPLILNDTRELKAHKDMPGDWGDGNQLFALPFKSPERSGLDYIAVGLWWGILAQERDDTKPDWTLFAEGRFTVGDKLEAACSTVGGDDCRDLQYDSGHVPGEDYPTKGGISRGVNELAFGMRLSRRYGWIDPFFGIEALLGWPQEGTAYQIDGNAVGQINDMPPIVGTLDFGLEFIPWDVPELHRKLSIGLGGGARYHSEGREYTPLFDALGVSPYFRQQDFVDFNGNGVNDGGGEHTAVADTRLWTGMTDVENYASFYGSLFVMIQPAKYVKIKLGTGLGHETEHFITKTDQCPADQMTGDGTCAVYNYGHRPELDTPGMRFRAEQTLLWVFFADLTAQF